jgi:hypothetical protein
VVDEDERISERDAQYHGERVFLRRLFGYRRRFGIDLDDLLGHPRLPACSAPTPIWMRTL